MHKLIVTSATYRQSSAYAASARGARSRQSPARPAARVSGWRRRWSATRCWRRAGCSAGRSAGRACFRRSRTGIWDIPYSSEKWTPSEAEDRYRRGLYVFIRRSAAYPSLMTFDATSREHAIVRRVRTNTPLQALTTLNDEAYFEAARALAARVLRETPPSPAASGRPTRTAPGTRSASSRPARRKPARSTESSRRTHGSSSGSGRSGGGRAHDQGIRGRRHPRRGAGGVDARRQRALEPR